MHKKFLSGIAAATVMTLALPALAQNLAVVNGKAVPKARMDAMAQQMAKAGRPVTPDMEGQLKDEIIAREIFLQEAQKKGLDASEDYKTQLALARETILIRELFMDWQKKNPVTDEAIKAEYDKFVAANSGKEFKARHILVEKEADAKDIIARIKKGAKFEDIAKKQSKDPGSAVNGGDLDWANPRSYVPEFTEALLKLTKGQLTDTPVKSQFGYHVIRLDDVRQAELPKLEEVKPQIAQQLQQQMMAKYQDELRAKAKVEELGTPPGLFTSCKRQPPCRGLHQQPGKAGSAVSAGRSTCPVLSPCNNLTRLRPRFLWATD